MCAHGDSGHKIGPTLSKAMGVFPDKGMGIWKFETAGFVVFKPMNKREYEFPLPVRSILDEATQANHPELGDEFLYGFGR